MVVGLCKCWRVSKITYFFSQSRDPAVQAAILAQLNAKYGSGVLPDAPKEMSKASITLKLGHWPGHQSRHFLVWTWLSPHGGTWRPTCSPFFILIIYKCNKQLLNFGQMMYVLNPAPVLHETPDCGFRQLTSSLLIYIFSCVKWGNIIYPA